jgi:hypothetical protein
VFNHTCSLHTCVCAGLRRRRIRLSWLLTARNCFTAGGFPSKPIPVRVCAEQPTFCQVPKILGALSFYHPPSFHQEPCFYHPLYFHQMPSFTICRDFTGRRVFTIRQVFTERQVFAIRRDFAIRRVFTGHQCFCTYFLAPILLYIFLHSY